MKMKSKSLNPSSINKPLILLSILIAFIFALPHLYGFYRLGNNYFPLQSNQDLSYINDETYAYAPEVQNLLKFELNGDPYLWEYKSSPLPFIGELASILPVSILSVLTGSVSYGFAAADLIFPVGLFLLIFFGLRLNGFSKIFSLSTSLAIIALPFFSLLIPKLSSYGTQLTGTLTDPLLFSRTPHPQISDFYLFAPLFLTALVLKNPAKKLVYLWAASIGLSVYSSPYVASTVFGGVILLIPAILKRLPKRTIAFSVVIIGFLSLAWLINFFQIQRFLTSSGFLLRSTFPQKFLFPAQLRFVAIALIILFVNRKDNLSKVLAAFLISASLMVDGHQLIFGRNIEADHWLTRVLAPLGTLALFLIVEKLLTRLRPNILKGVWFLAIIGFLALAFAKQMSWIKTHPQLTYLNSDKQKLLNQISLETSKNDVIGTLSPNLNSEIVALTGRRIYLAPGDRTLASSDEQIKRACDLIFLLNIRENEQSLRQLGQYLIGTETANKNYLDKTVENLMSCAKLKQTGPNYKLDYIVESDDSNQQWTLIPAK